MSRPFRTLILFTIPGLIAAGCAVSDEPNAPFPSHGGSSESPPVVNPYDVPRGDAEAAFERAKARLATGPRSSAQALTIAATPASPRVLILYDTTGPWGWLGELYALNLGALAGHFGDWTAKPAASYVAGDLAAYSGAIYIGSTFDEPLGAALLDDVLSGSRPAVWIGDNIWQLAARAPSFATTYGFMPSVFDFTDVNAVAYKNKTLTRYLPNGSGIMTYSSLTSATVVAQAIRADSTTLPWAVRGSNLTYIGENPLAYVTANDRYLVFADTLFDAFAPATAERHRALVRIEDVSPMTSPASLRAIADYLSSQSVPFSVALIPYYRDPLGVENDGRPRNVHLAQAPQVVSALKYMVSKGGTLILHGYTHQYGSTANPYDGVSANDFEFYRAHVDASNYVVYDGPVPGDSQAWADGRLAAGLTEIRAVGLPAPAIFEYPHYAGTVADSAAVRGRFSAVYHRGLYFGGQLSGSPIDYSHAIGVVYPYAGRDVFGFKVLPETMGSYEPEAYNNNPARLAPDLVATASANLVVRDGFASFYFHPYYPIASLQQIVAGVKAAGYTFVSASSL